MSRAQAQSNSNEETSETFELRQDKQPVAFRSKYRNVIVDKDKINVELSLLVTYSESLGHNIFELLSTSQEIIPAKLFIDNLFKVSSMISQDVDELTRKELEIATSEISIKNVLEVCRVDNNVMDMSFSHPEVLVDVKYFILLCRKRNEALNGIEVSDNTEKELNNVAELSFSVPLTTTSSSRNGSSRYDAAVDSKPSDNKIEMYLNSYLNPHYNMNMSSTPIKSPSENYLPKSPYDEEIKFSDDEDDDTAIINANYNSDNRNALSPTRDISPNGKYANSSLERTINLLRDIVVDTHLYHLIQLQLGFIDAYTLIPPRGQIIISKPREWLSLFDIKTALNSGNSSVIKNNDMSNILILLKDFSEYYREELKKTVILNSFNNEENNKLLNDIVIKNNNMINSLWFKKYLVYLRLSKQRIIHGKSVDNINMVSPQLKRSNTFSYIDSRNNASIRRNSFSNITSARENSNKQARASTGGLSQLNDNNNVENDNRNLNNKPVSKDDAHLRGDKAFMPMQWEKWVDQKVISSKSKMDEKPKDFKRLLGGIQLPATSALTKDDIDNFYLLKYQIIPEDLLVNEINIRIKKWMYNVDGRRDFKHLVNIEINKWQVLNKSFIHKLPRAKRNEVIVNIKNKLISKKVSVLKTLEAKSLYITKELFWKFFYDCDLDANLFKTSNFYNRAGYYKLSNSFDSNKKLNKSAHVDNNDDNDDDDELDDYNENKVEKVDSKVEMTTNIINDYPRHRIGIGKIGMKWGEWIKVYQNKQNEKIKQIMNNNMLRNVTFRTELDNRDSVIPLNELSQAIFAITKSSTLPLSNSLELRKSFIALKKDKEDNRYLDTASESILVKQSEFKKHLESVIAPIYNKLPSDLQKLADQAKSIHENIIHTTSRFYKDQSAATMRAIELEKESATKQSKVFNEWLKNKKLQESKLKQFEEERMARQVEEEEAQRKQNQNVYKKWLKRSKKNKYYSKVDNSLHSRPPAKFVDHATPWKQE